MSTDVLVCSNALLMLGENPINSFDDGANTGGLDRARIAKDLWPSTRDSLLRSHPWNCAIKRVTLSPMAVAPDFGFTYQYQLPGQWLRNVEINGKTANEVDYLTESTRLLINENPVYLRYVWQNTDVASWDPMLVEAAEIAMAMKMAYAISQSTQREQALRQQLFDLLRTARAVDGQDDSPATLGSFEILTARRNP